MTHPILQNVFIIPLVWSAFSALQSRTDGIMDVYQHCTKKSYLTKVHENIMTVFRLREWYSIYFVKHAKIKKSKT
jgi:hypothetical protein